MLVGIVDALSLLLVLLTCLQVGLTFVGGGLDGLTLAFCRLSCVSTGLCPFGLGVQFPHKTCKTICLLYIECIDLFYPIIEVGLSHCWIYIESNWTIVAPYQS